LEKLERARAKERQGRKGQPRSGKLPEHEGAGDTRDKVADAVGMSPRTYEKAKKVVEAAEADPALAPVVEEMDRTGKVDPSFQEVVKRKPTAAEKKTPVRPTRGRQQVEQLQARVATLEGQLREVQQGVRRSVEDCRGRIEERYQGNAGKMEVVAEFHRLLLELLALQQ
jgi:hypothetical protein